MTTTLEEKGEEQGLRRVATGHDNGAWARVCAMVGAAVWCGTAVAAHFGAARIGGIELLFLLAPLVVVPLGMELGRVLTSPLLVQTPREKLATRLFSTARSVQPVAALCVVIAFLLPPGRLAGALACGWMLVCLLMGAAAIVALFSSRPDAGARLFHSTLFLARVDLVVGGSWLVASRLGMHPMGIQEPIGLLTAVHFHFAGFATATIAAAMLGFSRGQTQELRLKWIVPFVIGMPYLVAVGFVVSPGLKMAAASLFSVSVAALAILLRSCGRRAEESAARVLLQVAAAAVFAGMVLATVYAIADFYGSDVLTIPQMARTHGILNAVGFCMCGLLGWIVENENHKGHEGTRRT